MSNKRINVSALEFDQIKQNLQEFLKGQSQFSDYNFEGSNLSILLDILAYNTHYNALYTNMALNESFLDTASRRNSVVSLAKALGYVPRSTRSARAVVSFVVSDYPGGEPPEFLTLPAYTTFTGVKEGIRYAFRTMTPLTSKRTTSNTYNFNNVELVEGTPANSNFVVTDANAYMIKNRNVDTSTMTLAIKDSVSSTAFTTYHLATEFASLRGDSEVFFLRETDDGFYEISFGDNIVGKRPANGSIVVANYFVSSGQLPNEISTFTYTASLDVGVVNSVVTVQKANGGALPESIEDIRFNAPNMYAAQNRAVTAIDFETIIRNKLPLIGEVTVWGGENNNPPVYGKVFISAKTASGLDLTLAERQHVERVLQEFKSITAVIDFVDAAYIDVEVNAAVYYDNTLTTRSPEELRALLIATVNDYNTNELRKFNRIFRSTALQRMFDMVDPSITSSVIRTKIYRAVVPLYNTNSRYNVAIGTPIEQGSFRTNYFRQGTVNTQYFLQDDKSGVVSVYYYDSGLLKKQRDVGTVDYSTGTVSITGLNITGLFDLRWELIAVPASGDILSVYNQIVRIDASKLEINMIPDTTNNGRALTGNSFQFVSPRL
jgi:hypothetical protein